MRRLDKSVMKADDAAPDVCLSEMYQVRNEPSALDEVVSTERLFTMILEALSAEKYLTIEIQARRDPDLSLKHIQCMIKSIFINHSKKLSVTKNNQGSNRRGQYNGRESVLSTVIT